MSEKWMNQWKDSDCVDEKCDGRMHSQGWKSFWFSRVASLECAYTYICTYLHTYTHVCVIYIYIIYNTIYITFLVQNNSLWASKIAKQVEGELAVKPNNLISLLPETYMVERKSQFL